MAKELPYFKFEPNQWENGNVQLCPFEAQGVFINLCAMYWQRLGDLPYKLALVKVCRGDDAHLKLLTENGIIKISKDCIKIDFLDVQLEEFQIISSKRSNAGRKGGENRILAPENARIRGNQIYVLHCFDDIEEFIKVGITSESISRRFSGKMPYQYDVLFQFSTDSNLDLESHCNKELYSKYAHRPKIEFVGYLECFKMDVFNELNDIIKHRTGNAIAMPKPRSAIRGDKIKGNERNVLHTQKPSDDYYQSQPEAFESIKLDDQYIEDCTRTLTGRGWRAAEPLDIIAALKQFLNGKADLSTSKQNVRQHFKNWIIREKLENLQTYSQVFKTSLNGTGSARQTA